MAGKSNAYLKLIDRNEFQALWESSQEFQTLAMNVFHYLERMRPGEAISLNKYTGDKLSWIIKTACLYMYEWPKFLEYEFNDEYTAIRRSRELTQEERDHYLQDE